MKHPATLLFSLACLSAQAVAKPWNIDRLKPSAVALRTVPLSNASETLPPLSDGKAPQTFEELWAGFDPRAEPLEVEVLHEWEEQGVIMKVLRYRIGIFKGQRSMMAAVYGYPKGAKNLPGLLQIHGGGQYTDHRAVLTNAKRGYATISIAWAGRISAPKYNVSPKEVELFWAGATDDPNYRLTTDWGALDAYHAPCRNPKNAFAHVSPATWTLDDVESPRNNPWFLCTLGARRALTFLEQQPQVDRDKLGVYGHSMGGKLTVMTAAADDRIKAAAPSCGGISDRPVDNQLYSATIADGVNLEHITCPIIFLSPSNDFHGRIDDLPTATAEISSRDWRVTCSPHGNHQDTAEYQIAGLLWFDQHLRESLKLPNTPQTWLELNTEAKVPTFTIRPDSSKTILGVDIFYTQHGQMDGQKDDRENTICRFWRRADATPKEQAWLADLPLVDVAKPLWVYANVLYALDRPQSGAGYYYSPYTAEAFNLSSMVQLVSPEQLQAAGVRASIEPSLLIESFEDGWEKQWFTYKPENWARKTHKVYDKQWHAPVDATLAFDVRSTLPNRLVVGIDATAAEVQLQGGANWQSIELTRADFRSATGEPLPEWTGIRELRLGEKETLKSGRGGKEKRLTLGAPWKGESPEFRNLRWVRGESPQ